MTLLVMPAMLDHLILGMDFLCTIDTTLYCGNVALTMRMKDEPNEETSLRNGPNISKESDRSGEPQSFARSRTREKERKRGLEAQCWSPTQKVGVASAGGELPVDEQGTSRTSEDEGSGERPEERPPEVKLVGLEAEDVGEIRSSQSPRSPIGQEEDEENTESSPDDTVWPEDLQDELKEFLVAELALFEGLDGVSNIAEHSIRMRDDKPLKQR
ncbi:hypothetical protein AWZ03_015325, partial [Drosophila navojoa]